MSSVGHFACQRCSVCAIGVGEAVRGVVPSVHSLEDSSAIVGQLRDICGATGAAPPASGSHVSVADTCRVMHGTWGMFGRGAMLPATMFDLSMWRRLVRRGHCCAVVLLSPVLQLCRDLGFFHNRSGYVSLRRSGIVRNSSLQC